MSTEQLPVIPPARIVKRRRRWTWTEKLAVVKDAVETSVHKAAAKHNVTPRLIFAWKRAWREGSHLTDATQK